MSKYKITPHCGKIKYDRLQRTCSAFVPLTSCPFFFAHTFKSRRVKWPCIHLCWTAARRPTGNGRYSYQTHASHVGMVYYCDVSSQAATGKRAWPGRKQNGLGLIPLQKDCGLWIPPSPLLQVPHKPCGLWTLSNMYTYKRASTRKATDSLLSLPDNIYVFLSCLTVRWFPKLHNGHGQIFLVFWDDIKVFETIEKETRLCKRQSDATDRCERTKLHIHFPLIGTLQDRKSPKITPRATCLKTRGRLTP